MIGDAQALDGSLSTAHRRQHRQLIALSQDHSILHVFTIQGKCAPWQHLGELRVGRCERIDSSWYAGACVELKAHLGLAHCTRAR